MEVIFHFPFANTFSLSCPTTTWLAHQRQLYIKLPIWNELYIKLPIWYEYVHLNSSQYPLSYWRYNMTEQRKEHNWKPQWYEFSRDWINSSPSSAVYMHGWTGSALVQVMACRQTGDKPLPKPMLIYCHWTPLNKLKWNSNRNIKLFIHQMHLKMSSAKSWPLCPGEDE